MVKGTTRQVVVVKGPHEASFEQAIFLVRKEVISKGGITEETLLREAQQSCHTPSHTQRPKCIFWSFFGAAITGLAWLISSFV